MAGLTKRQLAFARQYAIHGPPATSCYLAIAPGVANATANVAASRLLRRPDVQAEIERCRAAHRAAVGAVVAMDTGWTEAKVVQRLGEAVDAARARGRHDWEISGLVKIGQHLGMWSDRNEAGDLIGRLSLDELRALATVRLPGDDGVTVDGEVRELPEPGGSAVI